MSRESENTLYTAADVADILKLKKYTIYEMIKRGELPHTKIGKQVRVSKSDIDSYLRMNKNGTIAEWDTETSLPERPDGGEYQTHGFSAPSQSHNRDIIICGQDMCLELLLSNAAGILRSYAGSYNALVSMYNGYVTMAGCHLWDAQTDSYNMPYLARLLPGVKVGAIRLCGRMQGLYVQKGNPKKIKNYKDLA